MSIELIGISSALLASASWAIGAILFKKLGDSLSSGAMTLLKSIISILLLGIALLLTGYKPIDRSSFILLIISGILGIAVADTLFFAALQRLSARDTVLLNTFGQIFTVVLAMIFLHERLHLFQWLGIALIILGVTGVLLPQVINEEHITQKRGMIYGLLSAFCMAVSIIIAKEALASVSALQSTFIRMASGCVCMFIMGVASRRIGKWVIPVRSAKVALLLFFSVCVITFGGFWLSLVAIKNGIVAVNSSLISTEPMFALIFSAIFLKEKATTRSISGTFLTLIGIIIICAR